MSQTERKTSCAEARESGGAAMSKPNIIRAGDVVRVADPRIVLRVGYPKSPVDYLAGICEEHEVALREIFDYKTACPTLASLSGYEASSIEDYVANMPQPLRRALWDLAYLACKRDGFGGKERRVHLSEPMPEWADAEFEVASVRSAMEGDYFPPYYGTTYEGECDNEPGGLENQRVRRLAAVGRVLTGKHRQRLLSMSTAKDIEFPVKHLVKVPR